MTQRERRFTVPSSGGKFRIRTRVMDADDVQRAIRRMAHEVIERNHGIASVVVIGLQTGGVAIAESLAGALTEIEEADVSVGSLDATLHRDDIGIRPVLPHAVSDIPQDLDGRTAVLVDDVLFTGRTVRAALDALHTWGRPSSVQLAVMVDRGHRELPIRPDFVGKNLPTSRREMVDVRPDGVYLGELEMRSRETTRERR